MATIGVVVASRKIVVSFSRSKNFISYLEFISTVSDTAVSDTAVSETAVSELQRYK